MTISQKGLNKPQCIDIQVIELEILKDNVTLSFQSEISNEF